MTALQSKAQSLVVKQGTRLGNSGSGQDWGGTRGFYIIYSTEVIEP